MADFDNIQEQHNKPPIGWTIFFVGIIIWAIYYIAAFTPQISGWSFNEKFDKEMAAQKKVQATQAQQAAVMDENPYEHDAAAITEGMQLYEQSCSACHGQELKDSPVGVDLTADLNYGDELPDLFESVMDGRPGGMPPFASQLGKDRVLKVLAYIESKR